MTQKRRQSRTRMLQDSVSCYRPEMLGLSRGTIGINESAASNTDLAVRPNSADPLHPVVLPFARMSGTSTESSPYGSPDRMCELGRRRKVKVREMQVEYGLDPIIDQVTKFDAL